MRIHNAEHTFFYIDPNLQYVDGAVEGDGSSASSPTYNFPSTFNDNVIYLVRRSSFGYYAKLPCNVTSSNITSMVILGMPKEGEKYWDEMPADARSLWKDSDITGKAFVCHYSDSYERRIAWALSACRNFTMRNVTFMQYETEHWDQDWAITCDSAYGCNSDVQNCEFGMMIPQTVGSVRFDMALYNNRPDRYHGRRFLYFGTNWCNICTFKNIKIDNWGNAIGLHLGKPKNIILENIECHARTQDDCECIIGAASDEWRAPYVTLKNCSYLLFYSDNGYWMQPFISMRVDRVSVDGMTAGISSKQWRAPHIDIVGIRAVLDFSSRFTGSEIKNVNFNFPDFHGGSGSLLNFTYINDTTEVNSAPQKQYNAFKNVTISMCQVKDAKYSNAQQDDRNGNNFNSYNPGVFSVCRSGSRDRLVSSDFLLQDLHLSGYQSNILYACGAILDLTDIDIIGNVALFNCVGKIKSISSYYPGNILRDDGSNLLYIGKITCNKEDSYYSYNKQSSVILSGKSNILVHEVNGNCWTSDYWDPTYPHSYICTNDGLAGNYTCRTGRSKCQTWSAKCNQSTTNCSLKLINESADDWHWPLRIGYDPFKGITKAVTAGSYNATFFIALYGYNLRFDEIKDRLFIRIKLPSGLYVYSNAGECVLDTESTWENVEGTTNYKFVIPLDVTEDGNLEIDFTWSFYMDGGMTFLDPYPKLVARA